MTAAPLDRALNTGNHPLAGYAKLHESRRVDDAGAPALRDAVIRWLDAEPSQRSRLIQSLQRLNREHPRLYRVVNSLIAPVEQGNDTPTIRVMAAQLGMSRSTVHRSIVALRHWLRDEGFEEGRSDGES